MIQRCFRRKALKKQLKAIKIRVINERASVAARACMVTSKRRRFGVQIRVQELESSSSEVSSASRIGTEKNAGDKNGAGGRPSLGNSPVSEHKGDANRRGYGEKKYARIDRRVGKRRRWIRKEWKLC